LESGCKAFTIRGLYGKRAVAAARFPLAFLLLMIPPPAGAMEQVQRALQQGSAEASHVLFRLIGEPVFRQGNTFFLPGVTIEVATECSGIRSSIALFITSVLAGYVFLRSAWRRSCLVLAAIPIVVVKNAARIVGLTWLTIHVNPVVLHSSLHHQYGGLLFSALALAMMLPVLVLLHRSERLSAAGLNSQA
jgi:exosortase